MKNQRTKHRRVLEEVTEEADNLANSHGQQDDGRKEGSPHESTSQGQAQAQAQGRSIGFGELLHEISDYNSLVGQEEQQAEARQGQRYVEDETATEEQKQKAVGALSLITNSFDVQDFDSLVAQPVDNTISGISSTAFPHPEDPFTQDPVLYRVVRTELFRQAIEDEEQFDQQLEEDGAESDDKSEEELPRCSRTLTTLSEADLQPSTSRQGKENQVPPKKARGRKRVKALVRYSPLSEGKLDGGL